MIQDSTTSLRRLCAGRIVGRLAVVLLLSWSAIPMAIAQATDQSASESDPSVSADPEDPAVVELTSGETLTEEQVENIKLDAETSEDPDAARRIERATEPRPEVREFDWNVYGSLRLHAINAFNEDTLGSEARLGDGASRVGINGAWTLTPKWSLLGRLESGFDVLDTFTNKGQTNEDDQIFVPRLYNLTLESDAVYVKVGKSWSVYYKVAGVTDRFSIFTAEASGAYNAGSDGGATGLGRADDSLQTNFYVDIERFTTIRPINLNVQVQSGQPIPRVPGRSYDHSWSVSAWQDTNNGIGVGLAYHRSYIDNPQDPLIRQQGIDGDAQALALGLKTSGSDWFASFLLTWMDNIETTDQFQYFNGRGAELFAQWQFRDRWWLVGGGNWLEPDEASEQAGEFEIRYGVLGMRYTFDGFNRMMYAEWRLDESSFADGTPRGNEFTVGVRWDFGY